jgi:hypothetical protein
MIVAYVEGRPMPPPRARTRRPRASAGGTVSGRRLEPQRLDRIALGERRQPPLLLVGGPPVTALLVGEHEAEERDHGARRAELDHVIGLA